MRVEIVADADEMGRVGADLIAQALSAKPHFILGLATGSTPLPVYRELVRRHREEGLDFSRVITFNLDEYVGLAPDHEQSYRRFMNENLFDHVNIPLAGTHVPDGMAEDPEAECAAYEAMIEDVGGIDLQVLGIGSNGHIGFNEPGGSLASRTRQVRLAQSTVSDNARFFASAEEVPASALSMGIGTVLDAERVVLFASGENKAEAVAAALEGPLCAKCPASALQLHPDAVFVLTEDAASNLALEY